MLAVAAQIVAYLIVAAALGFITAWALRGALLRRLEVRAAQSEAPTPPQFDSDAQLAQLQARLAERERQLAVLEARLAALEANHAREPAQDAHAASAPVLESPTYGDIPRFLEQLGVGRARAPRSAEPDQLTGNLFEDDAPPALPRTLARDDLKKIRGIGPRFERHLNELGIQTYRQIALWSDADIAKFARELRTFAERIQRDEWVRSAREQHLVKYGERL